MWICTVQSREDVHVMLNHPKKTGQTENCHNSRKKILPVCGHSLPEKNLRHSFISTIQSWINLNVAFVIWNYFTTTEQIVWRVKKEDEEK